MAKASKTNIQESGNTKASFWIDTQKLKKFKVITAIEGITQTEIIDNVLSKYINDWEKKNGPAPVK